MGRNRRKSFTAVAGVRPVDANPLTAEESAKWNAELAAKGIPPIDAQATALRFPSVDRDMARVVAVFFAVFAAFMLFATVKQASAGNWSGLLKLLLGWCVWASLAAFFVWLGSDLWVALEADRLCFRRSVKWYSRSASIPLRDIRAVNYGTQRPGGCWLLLENGESVSLLQLIMSGGVFKTELVNSNAGFLARMLSRATGLPISGDIDRDGLGALDEEIDIAAYALESVPVTTTASPEMQNLLAHPPAGWGVSFHTAQLRSQFMYIFGKPVFAVYKPRRSALKAFCGALVAGVAAWYVYTHHTCVFEWVEYLVGYLRDSASADQNNSPILELEPLATLVAAAVVGVTGVAWAVDGIVGSVWLVFLPERMDGYHRALGFSERKCVIRKTSLDEVAVVPGVGDACSLEFHLRGGKKHRVPAKMTGKESEWVAEVVRGWTGDVG